LREGQRESCSDVIPKGKATGTMPHPKVQAQGSAMVGRNQLGSRMGAQTLVIREGARGRQGDVEER